MATEFKVGKYYRAIGTSNPHLHFNPDLVGIIVRVDGRIDRKSYEGTVIGASSNSSPQLLARVGVYHTWESQNPEWYEELSDEEALLFKMT
jgi:hypothetical protein